MAVNTAFNGRKKGVQKIVTSGASQSVNIDESASSIRLVNAGDNACHVCIGKGSQTAETTDLVVRSDSEIVVTKGLGQDTIAALQIDGSTNLYIQTGEGKL